MKKIPGTEATPITTPEDFERYAYHLAYATDLPAVLVERLLDGAAASVRWTR